MKNKYSEVSHEDLKSVMTYVVGFNVNENVKCCVIYNGVDNFLFIVNT